MAQVGVQQPTNLMDMFSSASPMMWDIANQQVNDQTLGNLINRQGAAQSMDIERQKLPYELSQMDLQNQTSQAKLPGVQAESGLAQNKFGRDTSTNEDQIRATKSKLARDVSDDDLVEAENAIKTALVHPSAKVRETAEMLSNHIYDIKKERDKLAIQGGNQIEGIKETGSQARQTDAQAAAEGKYLKRWSMGVNLQIQSEGDPIKRDVIIRGAIQTARKAGKTDLEEEYTQYLNANKPAYDNAMKAKMNKPGQVNASEITGMPAVESPTAQPPSGAVPPVEATPETVVTPALITQSFGSYEPQKYQYRINPQTGKLQRKPI